MEKKDTTRLTEEAFCLIDQSALIPEEKENLKRNIEHFMSIVNNHKHLAGLAEKVVIMAFLVVYL